MSTCSWSRPSSTSTSSWRPSRPCARVSSLPIVALLTFDEDGETVGGVVGGDRGRAPCRAGRGGDRHEPRRRPTRGSHRARRDGLGRPAARRDAERRPGVIVGQPRGLPPLEPRLLRRVRGARLRPRRAHRRGCCGTTPAQIEAIRTALAEQRRPSAPFEVAERELAVAPRGERRRDPPGARTSERGVGHVRRAGPAEGRTNEAMLAIARTLKESGKVGFVDINDNPMARARMNALMVSIAIERELRAGDDPARHAARHDGHGPRGRAPRRACRGCAEHPRRDWRPAGGRRLPRLARRLRGRLDRARAAPRPAEPAARTSSARRSTRRPRSSSASP